MTDQDRISAVETALRAACTEAREQGLVLVRGDFIVYARPAGRRKRPKAIGSCAMGAHDLTCRKLGTKNLGVEPAEYDAIEHGWDGERAAAERDGLPMPWFEMGARLAAEFQPVAASSLEAG